MSLFKTFTLEVNRYSQSYVNGRPVKVLDDTFNIETSWQPVTGEDLENLPEGKRAEFTFRGYPNTQLLVADPKKQNQGDIITGPDGYQYEVIRCEPWQNTIISHYKFIATRIKENAI